MFTVKFYVEGKTRSTLTAAYFTDARDYYNGIIESWSNNTRKDMLIEFFGPTNDIISSHDYVGHRETTNETVGDDKA